MEQRKHTKKCEYNVLQEKKKLLLAQQECIISIVKLLETDKHVPKELLVNLQEIQNTLSKYKVTDNSNIQDLKVIVKLSLTNNEMMVMMLEKFAEKDI